MPDVDEAESPSGAALTFVLAGSGLLAMGALLHAVTAAQRIAPGFLTINSATSVGRLVPAAETLAVYGGLGMLATGVALELARLIGRTAAHADVVARGAGALVTLAVGAGSLALLAGHTTGRPGLELPRPFAVALALGFAAAAAPVLRRVASQPDDEVHPAIWFIGAGVISGPALLLLGSLARPAGVNDALVVAFTTNGLGLLWLGSIAIGAAMWVVPAASGVPLYSRSLAAWGFWGWVALAPLSAPVKLLSGPGPDTWETVGIAASIALAVPVLAIVTNLGLTYARRVPTGTHSAALRFALAGTAFFAAYGVLRAVGALRNVGDLLHLTVAVEGSTELALYGVVGCWLAAAVYAVLPGLTGHEPVNPAVSRRHVWLAAGGVATVVAALFVAGIVQGGLWSAGVRNGTPYFLGAGWQTVSDLIRPWLWLRTVGEVLLFAAWATLFQQVLSTLSYGEPIASASSAAADAPGTAVVRA